MAYRHNRSIILVYKVNKEMNILRVWQYALGSYTDDKTKPYDTQMLILRTFWVLLHITTCLMIILGNGRVMEWW